MLSYPAFDSTGTRDSDHPGRADPVLDQTGCASTADVFDYLFALVSSVTEASAAGAIEGSSSRAPTNLYRCEYSADAKAARGVVYSYSKKSLKTHSCIYDDSWLIHHV